MMNDPSREMLDRPLANTMKDRLNRLSAEDKSRLEACTDLKKYLTVAIPILKKEGRPHDAEAIAHYLMGQPKCSFSECTRALLTVSFDKQLDIPNDIKLILRDKVLVVNRYGLCCSKETFEKTLAKLETLYDHLPTIRNFQGISARGIQELAFNNQNYAGVDFTGTDLCNSNFNGSDCSGANFQTRLGGSSFQGTNLTGATITIGGEWENFPKFTNSNLTNTKINLVIPEFPGQTSVTTALQCAAAHRSRHLFLNHLANSGNSVLSTIDSIDDKYEDLKLQLMSRVIDAVDASRRQLALLSDDLEAIRYILLKNKIYLKAQIVRSFILDVVLYKRIQDANIKAISFSGVELELLLPWAENRITDNDRFHLENSGCINQILYHAAKEKYKDTQIGEDGKRLFNSYFKKFSQVTTHVEQVYLEPPQFGENFCFSSRDGRNVMAVDKAYHEKFLLEKNENTTVNWPDFFYFEKNDSGMYAAVEKFELDTVFDNISIFKRLYLYDQGTKKFHLLLDQFQLSEDYHKHFRQAMKVKNYGTKFVELAQQEYLLTKFSPFMGLENTARTTIDSNIVVTDDHCNSIFETYGYRDESDKEKAILLFCLAAVFARYSSSYFFGTEENSPIALREYPLALLNKAYQLDNAVTNQLGKYQDRFVGKAFSCTAVLSGTMFSEINEKSDPQYKKTLQRLKPPAWG
jgi:uncharacterized protein YjbI with pentapeptide repeats